MKTNKFFKRFSHFAVVLRNAILLVLIANTALGVNPAVANGPTVRTFYGQTVLQAGEEVAVVVERFQPNKDVFVAFETKADGTGENLKQIDLFTGDDGGASGTIQVPDTTGDIFLRARQYDNKGEVDPAWVAVTPIRVESKATEPIETSKPEEFDLFNITILGIPCLCLVVLLAILAILLAILWRRYKRSKK